MHTKGPWEVKPWGDRELQIVTIDGNGETSIAFMESDNPHDAVLVANAPIYYNALKQVYDQLSGNVTQNDIEYVRNIVSSCLTKC
jgi:hypothetical protein